MVNKYPELLLTDYDILKSEGTIFYFSNRQTWNLKDDNHQDQPDVNEMSISFLSFKRRIIIV